MTAAAAKPLAQTLQAEPVLVYGTSLAGELNQDAAQFAGRYHDAQPGVGTGANGHAFALPYLTSDGALLSVAVMQSYVESFVSYALQRADSRFQITRFGCNQNEHDEQEMAALFTGIPSNCKLPGRWAAFNDPKLPARLLCFDPGARLSQPPWQQGLEQYLSLNQPLWGTPSVELVSVGTARSLVAGDTAARKLGLKHRIISADADFYGDAVFRAAEFKALNYATHFLCATDLDTTSDPQQIRLLGAAARCGLFVDMLHAES